MGVYGVNAACWIERFEFSRRVEKLYTRISPFTTLTSRYMVVQDKTQYQNCNILYAYNIATATNVGIVVKHKFP